MKFVTLLAITALLASAVFSVFLMSHEAVYVIGGDYDLPGGQSLDGDLYALFADVRLGAGAQVRGRIYALCADLELAETAHQQPVTWDLFGFTVRIPGVARLHVSR